MIVLKNKLLLKKSFEVRKLLDILLNSNNIVFLHVDKFYGDSFENFKQELQLSGVNVSLINKDRIILSHFSLVAKGPTLVVYSENFFYNKLISLLEKNKISYEILLLKSKNYTSLEKINIFINKYNMSSSNVYNFFFFLINFYKNMVFIFTFMLKNYYKQLLLLFYNRLFILFFFYKSILNINNNKNK